MAQTLSQPHAAFLCICYTRSNATFASPDGHAVVTLVALVVGYAFGGSSVATAVAILALPPVAWAFDNDSGTFLILATLFVVTIGVMVLLALMALVH